MAKSQAGANEQAINVKTGALAAQTFTPWFCMNGRANLFVFGNFVATCRLERSFDAGTTVLPVTTADGTVRTFTGPDSQVIDEPERGMLYRLNCTNFVSGEIDWRFSQ